MGRKIYLVVTDEEMKKAEDAASKYDNPNSYKAQMKKLIGDRVKTKDEAEHNLYFLAGGLVVAGLMNDPKDPLCSIREKIDNKDIPLFDSNISYDEFMKELHEKIDEVASLFFEKIDRKDLLEKYKLSTG